MYHFLLPPGIKGLTISSNTLKKRGRLGKKSLFRGNASLTLLKHRAYRECTPLAQRFVTAEPLEVLRLNFAPVTKFFLGTFSGPNQTPF